MLPHMLNFRQTLTSSILLDAIHFKSRIHICEQQGPFKVPNHYAAETTCQHAYRWEQSWDFAGFIVGMLTQCSVYLYFYLWPYRKKKKGKQKSTSHKEEACFSSTPNLKIQGKKYLKEKTKKKKPTTKTNPKTNKKKEIQVIF